MPVKAADKGVVTGCVTARNEKRAIRFVIAGSESSSGISGRRQDGFENQMMSLIQDVRGIIKPEIRPYMRSEAGISFPAEQRSRKFLPGHGSAAELCVEHFCAQTETRRLLYFLSLFPLIDVRFPGLG